MGQGLPKGASRTFEEKREDGGIRGSGGESGPGGSTTFSTVAGQESSPGSRPQNLQEVP